MRRRDSVLRIDDSRYSRVGAGERARVRGGNTYDEFMENYLGFTIVVEWL